ncbi:restriction endonuclease subunit S [Candidatus Bathyarchaeota archaeon]|nr:restriction endonuclease subunit S [Candidatus Bathyarchaeota archaeon]
MKFYKETNFKETPIGKIPKDWNIIKLGDIAKFKRGFSYRSEDISKVPTGIRFITINDLKKEGGTKRNAESIYLRSDTHIDPDFFVHNKDILIANTDMTKGFIIGAPLLIEKIEKRAVYSMDLTKLVFDHSQAESKFLFYFLTYRPMRQKMKASAQGTNVLHLNHELVKNFLITLPPIEEQQNIAEILSCIDLAVQKIDEVIARAERLKKGLMQQLLTKGIGHKEFKETPIGKIPKEWRIVKIGEVTSHVNSGLTPRGGKRVYLKDGIPLIRSQNVLMNKLDLSDVVFISKEMHQKMSRSAVIAGDLLLNITGASIGRVAAVPETIKEANVNQHVCRIRFSKDIISQFAAYYLATPEGQRQILRSQAGATRQGLNFQQVKAIKLPCPPLSEQKLIVEILSSLDTILRLKEEKKKKLVRMKRRLMDLLLTGKVRVSV